MGLVTLQRKRIVIIGFIECRANGRAAGAYRVPVKQSVHPVFIEVLIDADVVLFRVVEAGRIEVSLVEHGRAAWDVIGAV